MSQLGVVDSVLVANGLIVAVGDRTSVEASLDGPTLTIDLKQNCVLPGFIDAHSHPVFNAELDVALDLSGALSISDMVEIFATAASTTPAGKWIHGMSLDLENFDRLPTRWDLDEATSTHPVVAYINGGHFVLANTKTLNERGVNEATPALIDTTTANAWIEQTTGALGSGTTLIDNIRAALVALGLISGST